MKAILIFTLLILGLFNQTNSCAKQDSSANAKIDKSTSEKFLKIHEIKQQNPTEGIYETQGFVAKIYTCPPCPPKANCKPCMRDNIVISEENKSLNNYDLSETEIIIFTKKAKSFKKDENYRFKIEITDKRSTDEPLNDIELISFEETKD